MHLIILVIWKLSDHKHFQAQQQQLKDPWPHPHPAVPVAAAEDAPSLVVKPKEEFNAADDDDDDDLDATWNAIMQKTRPATAPAMAAPPAQKAPPAGPPPPRARDPSIGAEEMNRRFDDFIKKNRHSFGRQ